MTIQPCNVTAETEILFPAGHLESLPALKKKPINHLSDSHPLTNTAANDPRKAFRRLRNIIRAVAVLRALGAHLSICLRIQNSGDKTDFA